MQDAPLAVHTLYGETMGTRWRVDLCAPPRIALDALHGAIQARLDDIVAQMSTYAPDSALCRFNRAPAASWQALPDDFFAVMACALEIATASDGAFDPTLGTVVGAWGFGAGATARHAVPDAATLAAARQGTGWQRLQLRHDTRELLQPGGVSLDLSAIAKGYAVDALQALLRDRGFHAALVDVGGELRGEGRKPDGSPWRVLVEAGDDEDGDPCVLVLDAAAVATSGTRWHHFDADGRVYAHTLDPRSGEPVRDAVAAVSVVADDAMRADAWSTALTVMGPGAGFAFAQAHALAARFVPHDGTVAATMTPAFEARLAA